MSVTSLETLDSLDSFPFHEKNRPTFNEIVRTLEPVLSFNRTNRQSVNEEDDMGGPIVRTGTTPKFWENYDRIFGGTTAKKSGEAKKAKAEVKSAKKSPAKKAAGKKKK